MVKPFKNFSTDDASLALPSEVLSELELALSEVFNPLSIRFEFSVQILPEGPRRQRLCIHCESSKSLDYQLLADPLGQRLRALQLEGFQDAIVCGVKSGARASSSDWQLRIDLTPPVAILEEWARWGDIQAITILVNLALQLVDLQVTGILKNWRLHLFCCTRSMDQPNSPKFPNKAQAIEQIVPMLSKLVPQGIQGATIYGVRAKTNGLPSEDESPLWVHWLDLPAATDPRYALSPLALAEKGNLDALTFVLQRLLNPDLEQCFRKGAIELSLLIKDQILHVMSEAPVCPVQSQIVEPTLKVVRQLSLPGVNGVRVYGRIAGQELPSWSYGSEFQQATLRLPAQAGSNGVMLPATIHWRQWLTENDWLRDELTFPAGTAQLSRLMPTATSSGNGLLLNWRSILPWATVGLLLVSGLELAGRSLVGKTNMVAGSVVQIDRPTLNNTQLDEKLAIYRQFCANGSPDVLIVGSSRALRGVDPNVLRQELVKKGYPAARIYNLGINGATAQLVDLLLRKLIEPTQMPKLVIWADGARAFNDGRPDRTFNTLTASAGYRQLPGGEGAAITNAQPVVVDGYDTVDRFLNQSLAKLFDTYRHRDRLKDRLQEITPGWQSANNSGTPAVRAEGESMDATGFLPVTITFDPNTYYQKYVKVSGDSDGDYASFTLTGAQDLATRRTTDFLRQRNIPLIFVNIPLSDRYLDASRKRHELAFKQYMQDLAKEEQLQFIDLVGSWTQDYGLYSDPSHLNRAGAVQVSNYLVHNAPINWSILATSFVSP